MTEKLLVVKNTQILGSYFPAYKKYFGYTEADELLSPEELEQRKQKLYGWVQQTKPIIDEIYQYITKSEHNACGFLPHYTAQRTKQTQSRQRIPFHNFNQDVMLYCHQNIPIQQNKNRQMRRQILKIKTLLDKLITKRTIPRQQVSQPKHSSVRRSKKSDTSA